MLPRLCFVFFKNEQIFHVTNTYTILFLSSKIVFLILFDEFRQLRIQFTTNHYIGYARGITKILADKMILNFYVLCSIFLVIFFDTDSLKWVHYSRVVVVVEKQVVVCKITHPKGSSQLFPPSAIAIHCTMLLHHQQSRCHRRP